MRNNLQSFLGIDYGLSKVGLAISSGTLSVPYLVIRSEDVNETIDKIREICEKEKIEKIVVGISEGVMAQKTGKFIEGLRRKLSLPILEFDETLSTQDAQRLAIESGMSRIKRKRMEDAMAASVMLQNYLDMN